MYRFGAAGKGDAAPQTVLPRLSLPTPSQSASTQCASQRLMAAIAYLSMTAIRTLLGDARPAWSRALAEQPVCTG